MGCARLTVGGYDWLTVECFGCVTADCDAWVVDYGMCSVDCRRI